MTSKDIHTLQSLRGAKEKLEFVRAHAGDNDFRTFLYYALNPLLTYNVSEKTIRKTKSDKLENAKLMFFTNIFECCEFLSRLRGIDNATIRQVKVFLYNHCSAEDRELYIKLLSKTLRLGVTAKTVNKAIPNLIPEWEVQQAYPIDKYPVSNGTQFWLTQKLNGVRATLYNGQLIARSGVPYKGVDHILSELSQLSENGLVFDGELTLKDKAGMSDNEAFRMATGILNSDSVDKSGILYTIFDVIPQQDFESANPQMKYSERRAILNTLFTSFLDERGSVRILPVLYSGTDTGVIDTFLEQMVREDKEGLMLNLDVPYKRARHNGILKIKRFYTMDLRILRCEEGTGRLESTLGAFVLQYKDNEVKVGSGFTDEQRAEFWKSRDEITGALCEVKYKEISQDKNTGLESLQFPVFISIRRDKDDVSYG